MREHEGTTGTPRGLGVEVGGYVSRNTEVEGEPVAGTPGTPVPSPYGPCTVPPGAPSTPVLVDTYP